ncbi:hypothetical protein ACFQJ5_14240 [Halomicroarcula sp. GCM10025324]|uniref:DUF7524 family protein n=1 Tax=Haloarcula TaxID=2237 RepID=UPI0023E805B6|nr:hypothetical protein [Halomicroarcula sp. ZS-22-S1]
MTDALPVHVNRQALHDLEVPTAFEATGSFDVRLVNHGESLHVHLHIDDALSGVATLEASNHYVNAETERRVRIEVDDDADLPVRGSLKVVTGYGAQTRYIDVELQEPGPSEGPVLVDESLSKPRPKSDEGTGSLLPEDQSVPVLALGGVALVFAVLAVTVFDNVGLMLGSLAVVGAALLALYVRGSE